MEKLLNYLKEKYSYGCYIIVKDELYILLRYEVVENRIVLKLLNDKLKYCFEFLKGGEDVFIFKDEEELSMKYLVKDARGKLFNFSNEIGKVFDLFNVLLNCDNDIVLFEKLKFCNNVGIENFCKYLSLASGNFKKFNS